MHRIRRTLALLAVAALAATALSASALAATGTKSAGDQNIVQTAAAAGQFKTLASLLSAAGLVGTLQGNGPFTVFAPTDAAFAKVPKAALDTLAANPAKLRSVLLYHVVAGGVTSDAVVKLSSAKTVNGQPVGIRVADGKVYVGGARVTSADVEASNGVIHVIDGVLLPKNILAYHTYKKDVALAAGQVLRFTAGKGYWAG